MIDHQNNLIAETPNELADTLLNLKKQRELIKKQIKRHNNGRQSLNPKEREAILRKTDGRCHICGGLIEGEWDADHVIAHSGGGEHKADNYLPAHSLCNNYRWDYLDTEFQIILKIGIWCRKQIEQKTALGQEIAKGFIKYEQNRLRRRKR